MALLSSSTLILVRISLLSTFAFFMFAAPDKLYKNMLIVGLGSTVSPATGTGSEGWIGVLLILQAVDDLMRLTGPQVLRNFMQVLPLRLLTLLIFTGVCYLFKASPLATGPTFAYLFYDTLLTGWIFAATREELNEDNKAHVRESRGYAMAQF